MTAGLRGEILSAVLAKEPIACSQVELWLHLYVDHECGAEEEAVVEGHLAQCETCARALALLKRTRAGLRDAVQEAPALAPAALLTRIRADMQNCQHAERTRLHRPALFLVLFVLVLFASAAAFAFAVSEQNLAKSASAQQTAVAEVMAQHQLDLPIDIASPDPRRVAAYLRPGLGEPVDVHSLRSAGLTLRGGRMVTVMGARAAQIVYSLGDGQRLSIFSIPDHDRHLSARLVQPAPIFSINTGASQVGAVRVGPTLFAVAGDVSPATMQLVLERLQD